ncbi:hypothetical protein R3P38DRAFT_2804125 [Favolaschia claudopus]|uniref:F-box domain-containing protein n=1 Tax=Favolaschia claudopus TaxID=2862362 RepID=A0AAV9ZRB3_9AGAR
MFHPTPIHRIPDEVVRDILLEVYEDVRYDWIDSVDYRTSLSVVCSSWQGIILHSPAFWTHIPITLATSPSFITRQLRHSGCMETSVLFNTQSFSLQERLLEQRTTMRFRTIRDFMREVAVVILPHFGRVACLSVICSHEVEWRMLMVSLRLARLTKLDTLSITTSTAGQLDIPLPAFSNTPHFRHLSISPSATWADTACYENVRVLRLLGAANEQNVVWSKFHSTLSAAPMLHTLYLKSIGWRTGGEEAIPLTVDSVTELVVDKLDPLSAHLLENLCLPNATTLRVIAEGSFDWYTPALRQVLPFVRCLHIQLCRRTSKHVAQLLGMLPLLDTLWISASCDDVWRHVVSLAKARKLQISKVKSITTSSVVRESEAALVIAECDEHCVLYSRVAGSDREKAQWRLNEGKLGVQVVKCTATDEVQFDAWQRNSR